MKSERTIEWQFGGWSGLPLWLDWSLWALLVVGGIALLAWLYRDTLAALTWRQRAVFAFLRSGFLVCLLLCLAGPTRVIRVYDTDQDARPLAVIVDRSDSMSISDLQGTTRLARALRVWKKVESDALHTFPGLSFFRFSSSFHSAPDLESAATAPESGTGETRLFASLGQALKNAPAGGYSGIATLTDGLDTTEATEENLISQAVQSHTPLYFAVGQNQQVAPDSLLMRELAVPAQVLRRSRFNVTVLVEGYTRRERDVPVSLTADGQPATKASLHLHAGTNLIPWTVPVEAGETGLLHLAGQVGEGADAESIAATIPVVGQDKLSILFYQGTLDWSFRFITSALRRDPSFSVTGLLNPQLNMTQIVTTDGAPTLTEMPGDEDKLKPFQIVVLSNVVGDQLSKDQQSALIAYVRNGGGLLFLLSDTEMARTFSGTDLESVLPVIFEAEPKQVDHNDSLEQFQELMHSIGGVDPEREEAFADDALNQPPPVPLQNFALPAEHQASQISDLFGGTLHAVPQFVSYAHVHGIKAGGEVLAVHPQDKTDTGESRALLVTQRFGQGQVTTLLTDALWRWRMALPSTSHDPEIFWQQLFFALAPLPNGAAGMRFGEQPFHASLQENCSFRIDEVKGTVAPTISAISPSGVWQNVPTNADASPGSWSFQFKPSEAGKWRVHAQDDQGASMETLLRVANASHAAELSGLPSDVDGLRRLAEATGGSLLNDGVPENWSASHTADLTSLISKHSEALWNTWWVLLAGLGFYVTELVWRRFAKLL